MFGVGHTFVIFQIVIYSVTECIPKGSPLFLFFLFSVLSNPTFFFHLVINVFAASSSKPVLKGDGSHTLFSFLTVIYFCDRVSFVKISLVSIFFQF